MKHALLFLFLTIPALAQSLPEVGLYHDPQYRDSVLTTEERIAVIRNEMAINDRNLIEQIEALKYEICQMRLELSYLRLHVRTAVERGFLPQIIIEQTPCRKGDEE